jgi:outer membrane protein assembly factor BamB/tetratricopeptide (TPR) repeat protein
MSLRGNLNSVDLANIFQMLSINQKEGTLNIFDGDSKKSIYFSRQGVSMLSRGQAKKDTLGQILLRYDRISEDQLDRALETQKQTGKLLGTVLEEDSLIPRDMVEDALRIQIEEEVYNLFIWKNANFEFIEGAPPQEFQEVDGVTALTFNVNSLIMEAARRIDEWEQIQRVVPTTNEIYRYSGRNMELSDDIFRQPYCEKVLAAINGKCTVEEIIDRSYVNKFEVCRIMSLLLEQVAIEPVPPEDLARLADAAIGRGDARDAVKFLERVVELGADTVDTHQALGEAYESLKEIRNAAAHYRLHAEHRLEKGEPEKALELYKKMCELIPTDLRSADRLIEVYVQFAEDVAVPTSEIVDRGKSLASIYLELKKMNPAVQTLHRVIDLAPEDFSLRHLLINIYLANNMSSEAITEYEAMAAHYQKKKDIDQVIKILRKILVIDRAREDVTQRLHNLIAKKEKKKRGMKRLVVVVVLIVGFSVLAYGYVTYEIEARKTIAEAEVAATKIIDKQNELVEPALTALKDLRGVPKDVTVETDDLVAAYRRANELRVNYQREIQAAIDSLEEVGGQFKFTTANQEAQAKQDDLRRMLRDLDQVLAWAEDEIQKRALILVDRAENLLEDGELKRPWKFFQQAWDIAPDQDALIGRKVDKRLEDFEQSFARINKTLEEIDRLKKMNRHEKARATALGLIREFAFPEVMDQVPVPVKVTTLPAGAEIRLNGKNTGLKTPAWIDWHPSENAEVALSLRGFNTARHTLIRMDYSRVERELKRVTELAVIESEFHKETIWESAVSGAVEAPPTRVGDSIYIATRNSLVYRVDLAKKKLVSIFDARGESLSGFASSPLLHDDHMFLAMVEGRLLRVSMKSGEIVWSKPLPGRVYAPLTLSGQMLYVGDISGHVSAWDAPSGELLWQHPLAGEIRSRPVVAEGKVFVTTSKGHLYAFDLSGEMVWDTVPGDEGRTQLGTPIVRDGRLYVSSADGMLFAYDLKTRKQVWSYRVPGGIRSDPVASGDVFFVGALDGYLYAIREGKLVDRIEIGASVVCSPAVDGTRILVLNDAGRILRAEFKDDEFVTQWRYEIDQTGKDELRMLVPPLLVGDRVLVIPESGRLYLLRD